MRFALIVLLFTFASLSLYGQGLTVVARVTDATCSANGRIDIDVSGGSGNYRFDLSGDCGENFQSLSDPFFSTLSPCAYLLIVTDRSNGQIDSSRVTVDGNDQPLFADGDFEVCEAFIELRGGLAPYEVVYQIDGGAPISVTAIENIPLGEIGDAIVDGTATDQCGNSRRFNLNGAATRVRTVNVTQTDDNIRVTRQGGVAPFTYSITSDVGTFTNANGLFPYDQVGCNLTATVAGACPNMPTTQPVSLTSRVRLDCINYSDGTVTVFVEPPGVQPYTFEVTAGGTTITSNSTTITGIPPDAPSVSITATDGCGENIPGVVRTTLTRLITPEPAESCNDTSLTVFIGRTCAGENQYPIDITCETCPGTPQVTQTSNGQRLAFPNGTRPGDYVLRIEDACGELQRCRDSVLLELIPACDSVIANVVQLFTCDNGTISRVKIADPDFRYSIADAAGATLEGNNLNGRFNGLGIGDYTVTVAGSCASFSGPVSIVASVAIDPTIAVDPSFQEDDEGNCQLRYRTLISQNEGPYELTELSGSGLKLILNDFDQDECSSFTVPTTLPPGDYRLVSLSQCGEKLFTLPDLVEERIDDVNILSTCPGASRTQIFSLLRTGRQWQDYFADLGLRGIIQNSESDFLIINGRRYNSRTIRNLAPGDYTVTLGLGFGSEDCAIDSATFTLPAYEPVRLNIRGNYLCGDSGEAALEIAPDFGSPPYVIRRLECANTGSVITAFDLAEGEVAMVDTDGVGIYCFVVEDDCGITSDFQVEVRSLADRIDFTYECSPAIRLRSDTLDGAFTWFNPDGSVAGRGNDIRVPPALQDRSFRLEVTTELCDLTASLDVPGRIILPSLSLDADRDLVQCDDDEIGIEATTDDASTITWRGAAAGPELRITGPGVYVVEATNDLGCVRTDSVSVRQVDSPAPSIRSNGRFCPGEPAQFGILRDETDRVVWQPNNEMVDSITILQGGEYSVLVTNPDGCSGEDTIQFTPPAPLQFMLATDSVSCFGEADGRITLAGTGGTGALTFVTANENSSLVDGAAGLPTGVYTVTLSDENNCSRDTVVALFSPDSLQLNLGPDLFPVFGDEVNLTFSNTLDTVTAVGFIPEIPGALVTETGATLRATESIDLQVTLLDRRGCPATDLIRIIVDRQLRLYAPTAFSPNNDGVNDRFTLQGTQDIASISTLRVFDRWGSEVFSRSDVAPNDLSAGWDGRGPDNQPLNPATFVWQAEVVFFDGTQRIFSGAINLVR